MTRIRTSETQNYLGGTQRLNLAAAVHSWYEV